MTVWFLIVLGVAWVAVFLPAAIRARQTTPLSATERFKRGLDLIAPSAPASSNSKGRWVVVPPGEDRRSRAFRRSQARRRKILESLVAGVVLTVIPGFIFGGFIQTVNLMLVGTLAAFVVLLVGTKRQREEHSQKIRSMDRRRLPADERVVFHEPQISGGAGS